MERVESGPGVLQDAADYGLNVAIGGRDWPLLKRKRDAYVLRLNQIYERNLEAKGVTYVRGAARFLDKSTLDVQGRRLTAPHIVVATGGKPRVPDLAGAGLGFTSNGFFELEQQPKRVAVVGSGYIACELAGSFHELGSQGRNIHPYGTSAQGISTRCWKFPHARTARGGNHRPRTCRTGPRCGKTAG